MCTKIKHPTFEIAMIVRRKMKNKALNVYKCLDCDKWHLGNSNRDYDRQARIDQLLRK